MRRIAYAVVVGMGILAAVACGIDAVGSAPAGDDGGAPPGADGGDAADGAAGDSRAPCVPTGAEICGNGLDDDCSGAADCDDPQCGCIPAPPAGWTPVDAKHESDGGTLVLDGGGLEAGCASPTRYAIAPRADGGTCACSCGAGPDACLHDSVTLDMRTGSSNCNDGTLTLLADGVCHALDGTTGAFNSLYNAGGAAPLAPKTSACPATAAMPPVIDDGTVATCAATTSPCAGGACVPPAPAGEMRCAIQDGDAGCPAGYPERHEVVPTAGIDDARACTCTCATAATACNSASVVFASDATCATSPRTVGLTGATNQTATNCNGLSGSGTPTHYVYHATPDVAGCQPAQASVPVTGSVVLPAASVLCCAP